MPTGPQSLEVAGTLADALKMHGRWEGCVVLGIHDGLVDIVATDDLLPWAQVLREAFDARRTPEPAEIEEGVVGDEVVR